jgi:hypothetical protein
MQTITEAFLASCLSLGKYCSPIEVLKTAGTERQSSLARVIEQKQSSLKFLEIDLIPDDLQGGICKKTVSTIPLETTTRAFFENDIRCHQLALHARKDLCAGSKTLFNN